MVQTWGLWPDTTEQVTLERKEMVVICFENIVAPPQNLDNWDHAHHLPLHDTLACSKQVTYDNHLWGIICSDAWNNQVNWPHGWASLGWVDSNSICSIWTEKERSRRIGMMTGQRLQGSKSLICAQHLLCETPWFGPALHTRMTPPKQEWFWCFTYQVAHMKAFTSADTNEGLPLCLSALI